MVTLVFILQYGSTAEFTGMANFTGAMKRFNLEGELLSDWTLEDGNLIEEASTSGKTKGENCYKVTYSSECVDEVYSGYPGGQSTGTWLECAEYETVIIINSEPCAESGGGYDGDDMCYTCSTGGTYVPTGGGVITGNGGSSSSGSTGSTKPKPIGLSADAMCGAGMYFDDGWGNVCQLVIWLNLKIR